MHSLLHYIFLLRIRATLRLIIWWYRFVFFFRKFDSLPFSSLSQIWNVEDLYTCAFPLSNNFFCFWFRTINLTKNLESLSVTSSLIRLVSPRSMFISQLHRALENEYFAITWHSISNHVHNFDVIMYDILIIQCALSI